MWPLINYVRLSSSVCPHCKMKTARVINTDLGGDIVHGRSYTCVDPEVKRSKLE